MHGNKSATRQAQLLGAEHTHSHGKHSRGTLAPMHGTCMSPAAVLSTHARVCRRYTYRIVPELGGAVLHSRQQALDWIHSRFRFVRAPAEAPPHGAGAPPGAAVEVSRVFRDGGLAQWALSDPDGSLLKELSRSASQLDELRGGSMCAAGAAGPSGGAAAAAHVLHILDDLSAPRVCCGCPVRSPGHPASGLGVFFGRSDSRYFRICPLGRR